jgi:hypothetical protein
MANYDEPPIGFDCGWSPDLGRVTIGQNQECSRFYDMVKEPRLWFQPEEIPALIEALKRSVADLIPDLQTECAERQMLIGCLQEYVPQKKNNRRSKGV